MKYLDVVHLVDTEGPLNETLETTFKRINEIFNIKIKPSKSNYNKILNNTLSVKVAKKNKKQFAKSFNRNTLNYKRNFNELKKQNIRIFKKKYRNKFKDSFGNGWKVNWNCVDHVNYVSNPQKRILGYHKVFDYYSNLIKKNKIKDSLHFHFHPTSLNNIANTTGNHYFSNSDNLFQILCRRILDRNWFPSVYRAGFHIENPDSNWFLDQFIPFDYSNQSCNQVNLNDKRFENWNNAPKNWSPYHPSHDDHRKKGSCRRWIARCLNIGTRIALLNQKEVDKAFLAKKNNKKTILAFTNHDFRAMDADFVNVYKMLVKSSKKYGLKFKFSDAREAFHHEFGKPRKKLKFRVKLIKNKLYIKSNQKLFGPQPFLALKTNLNKYFHENFYIQKPFFEWIYTFDRHSFSINDVKYFAFAANNKYGLTTIVKIKFKNKKSIISQMHI
tara:strand:+ start:309 stop:1634 length:1326 start_codon:yes stop_codon:yes gene_type:complete